jgi:hypothetical protein
MTTIYIIPNSEPNTTNYICDSQATIAEGQSLGLNGIFTIGTLEDANQLVQAKRDSFAIPEGALWVGKELPVEGGVRTVTCDLSTEPDNTDVQYSILNSPQGDHLTAIGLQQANEMFAQVKQNYINFCIGDLPITLDKWPDPFTPPQ